jgi:GTP-binding protein
VALTGITDAHIGDTVADKDAPEALPTIAIEAPTLSMYLGPNTSPFKGKEGEFTTSRQIGDRLNKELETNVALRVEEQGIGFKISGRGELHLSVLIEAMRREGYEFEVGRPQVVTITEDGVEKEPVEELQIEVGPEFVGAVSQELGVRRATMLRQEQTSSATARMTYVLPTRAMIGLRNQLLTATKGTVIMNSLPHGYEALGTQLQQTRNGVLIAFEAGTTTPYALENAESRGELFVGPAVEVYAGQIVGLNTRQEDMEINVCKAKHLTNMRSKSSDGTVQLTPFTDLSLEQCIDFIEDDELLEVTPKALRLRKRYLDANERKRAAK